MKNKVNNISINIIKLTYSIEDVSPSHMASGRIVFWKVRSFLGITIIFAKVCNITMLLEQKQKTKKQITNAKYKLDLFYL